MLDDFLDPECSADIFGHLLKTFLYLQYLFLQCIIGSFSHDNALHKFTFDI